MAPKKEAGGPTPADIEAEWQQKVAQWEREERQLQLAVRSQQGDTAHYQKTLQTMNSEVQSLAKTSQQLVKRNTEQRMQYKRQERQWSELEAKELTTQEEQARLVANLNEQIQKSRTDLSVMNGSFETEAASTAHKVAAVRFRQSAIAALREKVVKLRTERTRAIAELDSLQHLLEETQNSFRWDGGARSVLHAVLVHDRVPALQRLSNLLCHRLGYDVTVCHTQRSAASAEEMSLSKAESSNGREASAAQEDEMVRLSSVEGRQLARLEAAFAPKIRTIDLQRLPRGSDLSDVPASAHVAVTLSSLLRQVGRSVGTNDDDVRLVLLSAQENPDDAGDESDADAVPLALCFPVPAGPALSADNDLQLQHDKETTSLLQRPVVFSTEDVLRVLTGESVQKNSLVILEIAKANERGSCVMIAVPSPPGSQDDEHVFVLHRAPVNDGRTAGGESASVLTALHSSHSAVLLTEVLERIADDINYLGSTCPSVQQLAGNLFTAFVSTGEYRHTTPPLWLMQSVRGGDTPALLSAVTGEPILPSPAVGAVLREGALQETRVSARISLFVGGPSSLQSGRSALAWLLQKGKSVDSTFDASILPAVERSLPAMWDETLLTERYVLVRGANVAAAAVVQAVSLVLRHAYRMLYTAAVEGDSQELSGPPIDVSVACERGTSWCVLRLAVRTGNAQRATTLHEAMQIAPGTLYGRHRAAALRASKESFLNSSNSNNNNNSTTSSSQVLQILEANLPAALPQSDEVVVRSVAHVSLQSSVTKRQVLPLYDKLFSLSSQLDEQDGPQGAVIVVVDSAEEVRSFAPLRSLTVANSLRRHELSLDPFSLASQQLIVLVIHPTIDLSSTAGLWWEQYEALCGAESTLREQVPAAWLHAAVMASLSLRELNHHESSSQQQQHVDSPASDGASPTSSSSSAARRVIVQCLPPNILSFLTTCTYPCVLVTSCYLGNTARGSQGLVLPRNLSSTRRSADPSRLSDTVFSAADLAKGIAYFYRHILCVSQETLREGGNLNDEEGGEESLPPSFIKL